MLILQNLLFIFHEEERKKRWHLNISKTKLSIKQFTIFQLQLYKFSHTYTFAILKQFLDNW